MKPELKIHLNYTEGSILELGETGIDFIDNDLILKIWLKEAANLCPVTVYDENGLLDYKIYETIKSKLAAYIWKISIRLDELSNGDFGAINDQNGVLKVDNPLEYALHNATDDEFPEVIDGELVVWPRPESPKVNILVGDIWSFISQDIDNLKLEYEVFGRNGLCCYNILQEKPKSNYFVPTIMCVHKGFIETQEGINTTPVFVVEVVKSKLQKEYALKKLPIYKKMGVEVWIVDVVNNDLAHYVSNNNELQSLKISLAEYLSNKV